MEFKEFEFQLDFKSQEPKSLGRNWYSGTVVSATYFKANTTGPRVDNLFHCSLCISAGQDVEIGKLHCSDPKANSRKTSLKNRDILSDSKI